MQKTEYDILHFTRFSNTTIWSVNYSAFDNISTHYSVVELSKVMKRVKEPITIKDELTYKRITVRLYGQGVHQRDELLGKDIGTKRQFVVHAGQLVASRIDARNGAFGIIPDGLDGAIVTNDFWLFDVKGALPQFLMMVLSSAQFQQHWQAQSSGTTNRQRVNEDDLLATKIPLPSINEQTALVEKYNETFAESEELNKKANNLETEIEDYLFQQLTILPLSSQKTNNSLLVKTNFKNLVGWGARINCNPIKPQEMFQSNRYKNARLEYFGELNPITKFPTDINEISFIPMECVSDIYGEVIETYDGNTSDSKGYTKFKEKDILWAKITPCMQNGKCAIAKNLKNGFGYGSTEFHVFRANRNALPEYIYCFLRSKRLREVAISYFTGSVGQQRVGADFLSALTIPKLPIFSDSSDVMTQEKLVRHVFNIKRQIKELNNAADSLRSRAKKDFGEAIFGET